MCSVTGRSASIASRMRGDRLRIGAFVLEESGVPVERVLSGEPGEFGESVVDVHERVFRKGWIGEGDADRCRIRRSVPAFQLLFASDALERGRGLPGEHLREHDIGLVERGDFWRADEENDGISEREDDLTADYRVRIYAVRMRCDIVEDLFLTRCERRSRQAFPDGERRDVPDDVFGGVSPGSWDQRGFIAIVQVDAGRRKRVTNRSDNGIRDFLA